MRQMKNKFKNLLPFLTVVAFLIGSPTKAVADTAYAVWCSANKTLYFGYGDAPAYGETYNGQEITDFWLGDYVLKSGNSYPAWKNTVSKNLWNSPLQHVVFEPSFASVLPVSTHAWFDGACNLEDITGIENFNTSMVVNMAMMFHLCEKLTSLNLGTFDTGNVTDMNNMFSSCYDLSEITFGEKFDVQNVTSMQSMFENTGLTQIDMSAFKTEHLTNMKAMFKGSKITTIKFGGDFDTSKVTDMSELFASTNSLKTIDLSGLDTKSVTTMYQMFYNSAVRNFTFGGKFNLSSVKSFSGMFKGCWMTSLDLSSFNCSGVNCSEMFSSCGMLTSIKLGDMDVTNTSSMFNSCLSLTELDLSTLSTKDTYTMSQMFNGCSKLKTIYVAANWSTENVEYSSDMFKGCKVLVGNDGTKYDSNNVTAEFAHTGEGGYLTLKSASHLAGDANGDGKVDERDLNAIVSYIMGFTLEYFDEKAADLNGDKKVNVADIVEFNKE